MSSSASDGGSGGCPGGIGGTNSLGSSSSNSMDNLRDLAIQRRRLLQRVGNLRSRVDKCTIRVSKCAETYIEFFNLHHEYDPFLVSTEPSNPW